MKRNIIVGLALAVVSAVALAYWLGQRAGLRQGVDASGPGTAASETTRPGGRRILYYRHPMGLPDTSPTPKKAADGMDYVPVYEGEESQGSVVKIAPDRVQKLGVTTEGVERRTIARTVRAVGTVQADERRLRTISPKFEGWVKKLLVNTTGAAVRAGQPLMEVYSPDLITVQQEYGIARKGLENLGAAAPEVRGNMQVLIDGSLQRLRNWDIGEEEIRKLKAGEPIGQTLLLRAPIDGVVLDKMAIEGMRFMPGETLYRLADLSSLWIVAEVFEQDLGLIRIGQPVRVDVSAYPGRDFSGKVAFIYPVVVAETRTARVRLELSNRDGLLKPDMFASVEFAAAAEQAPPLTVANSAVLDSGTRRVVLVERGAGQYEPREVQLGRRGDEYTEVLAGLAAGERVVTSANFLIDAESNLKGALGGFGTHSHGDAGAPTSPAESTSAPEEPSDMSDMNMPPPAPQHKGH